MLLGFTGVPKSMGKTRDYNAILSTLKSNGADVYMPLNIYQEQPTALSLGFESDFYPPPFGPAGSGAIPALRQTGMKQVYSADAFYRPGQPLPTLASDPLNLIVKAGYKDTIAYIATWDEPAHRGLSLTDSQAVYNRIKAIDPAFKVVQIHAPAVMGVAYFAHPATSFPQTDAGMNAYLASVVQHAAYADIVGFDVYPIGYAGGQARIDGSGRPLHVQAVYDHVQWLAAALPSKQHAMVLQAFNPIDQFEPSFAAANFTPAEIAFSRFPTLQEYGEMMDVAALDPNMAYVDLWGASFTPCACRQGWVDALAAMKAFNARMAAQGR